MIRNVTAEINDLYCQIIGLINRQNQGLNYTPFWRGVNRVQDKIYKDLLKLVDVSTDSEEIVGGLESDLDAR